MTSQPPLINPARLIYTSGPTQNQWTFVWIVIKCGVEDFRYAYLDPDDGAMGPDGFSVQRLHVYDGCINWFKQHMRN